MATGPNVGYATLQIIPSMKGASAQIERELGGGAGAAGDAAGNKAGKGFASKFGGFAKIAGVALAGGLAVGAVTSGLSNMAEAAQESAKVTAQTVQTIKATGGAANITADQVGELAGSLSAKTGMDDELVQTGANLLLTFKNIRNEAGKGNDVFNQATQAALDLSAAGFGSVESASILMGKALNDPTKGMTALAKSGVTFTEQQKEQVKAMQASGDMLGAQKIILGEVAGQVGGVAEATADPMAKLDVAMGNLIESIGTGLLPAVGNIVGALVPAFETLAGPLGDVAEVLGKVLADAVKQIAPLLKPLVELIANLAGTVGKALAPILKAIIPIVGSVIQAFTPVLQAIAPILPVIADLAGELLTSLMPLLDPLIKLVAGLATILAQGLGQVIKAVVVPVVQTLAALLRGDFSGAFQAIKPLVDLITKALASAWEWVKGVLIGAWNAIKNAALAVWNGLQAYFTAVLNVYKTIFTTVWNTIKSVVLGVWNALRSAASTVFNAIRVVIETVVNVYRTILVGAWNAIKGAVIGAWNALSGAASRVFVGIRDTIAGVVRRVREIWDGVIGFFAGLPRRMASIFSGMWDGIKSSFRAVINTIIRWWNGMEFTIPSIDVGPVHLGGQTIGLPDIPYLAKGGIVNRPTLSVIGEAGPEAVLPLTSSTIAKLLGDKSSEPAIEPARPVHVHLMLDGREIAETVFDVGGREYAYGRREF